MRKQLVMTLCAAFLFMGNACNKGCKGESKAPPPPVNEKKEDAPAGAPKASASSEKEKLMKELNLQPGDKLYAEFDTSQGLIKAELFWEQAPMTVLNFVELAQGKKEWTHPNTHEKSTKPLYDNTIFHRVIKGFMIQGGDPTGTGMGGPGYRFKDEFNPALKHDKKGTLSMANAGPNTNGSQFFITEGPTPHLDMRHSVFGQVTDAASLEVISKIASVETGPQDKPKTNVVLKTVRIVKG